MGIRMGPLGAALFSLMLLVSPLHAAKYNIEWLIGHPTTDYFEDSAEYFKETVESGSNHRISVTIKTAENPWEDSGAGTPGPEIAREVASGKAQMGHSFTNVMGGLDNRLWAFDLPFLFRGYDHLEQVIEGPLGEELLNGLEDHGMVGLTFTYSGGAHIISSLDWAVRTPEDLKGMRIAVFGDVVDTAWLKALGAVPVSIRNRDDRIPDLARKGLIDGGITTWRIHYRALRTYHPTKFAYANLEGASYLVSVTYINKEFLEGLPAKYQSLIRDAAREAGRIERFATIDLNTQSKRRLLSRKWNTRAVALTAENRKKFEKLLEPVYRDTLNDIVGEDLIGRIRKIRGNPLNLSLTTPAGVR